MQDRPDAVMLFAAGFGTRMGALTATRPKPLLDVAGRPLLEHALSLVADVGVRKTVVNTHYLGDQVAAYLEPRNDVQISHEMPEILETGGGLRHALPLLGDGPVFTLNTDAVWTGSNPLEMLQTAWDPARMDALLILVTPDSAYGHSGAGDFVLDSDGLLRRGPGAIYTGAQIIRTDMLAGIEAAAFSLNLLWDKMLKRDRLFGVLHDGKWCDVGRPEGLATAEQLLADADHV